MAGKIRQLKTLPPISIQVGTPLDLAERLIIMRTLEATGDNRRHAAALLGVSVRTLQRKIFGIIMPKNQSPNRESPTGLTAEGN
jgi:transcriptional regulator with PAS, ATPase and Fis domain